MVQAWAASWLPEEVQRTFSKITGIDENFLRSPTNPAPTQSTTGPDDQRDDVMAAVDAIAKVRARKAAFDAAFNELEQTLAKLLRLGK